MSVREAAHQKPHGTRDRYLHYYAAYAFHFSSLKHAAITLLEIGVQNGGRLWTWRRYFANSRVFGDNGIYVIEDLHGVLKTLVDKLHGWALRSPRAEQFQASSETDSLERNIRSVHFHDSLCFIYKGVHDEPERSRL